MLLPEMARALRAWRIDRGWSQEELARRAGVAHRTIYELEAGRRPQPYPSTRKKIADALGIVPSDITELADGQGSGP
jgi:transcriptional regulator with XRE-family HTH domain